MRNYSFLRCKIVIKTPIFLECVLWHNKRLFQLLGKAYMPKTPGCIFIVSAASGTGKTTLVSELLRSDAHIQPSISCTTRAPREGEINGKHYFFISRADFQARISKGEFLEYAQVYDNYYGTSSVWVEETVASGVDVLLEIDVQGAQQVRRLLPQAISIFILPPSMTELARRLNGRGTESNETITKRLSTAQSEIETAPDFDYIIINDDLGQACMDLISIVRAERLRAQRKMDFFENLLLAKH